MADFSWMAAEFELSPLALTLRAQTIDATDGGRGQVLTWDMWMPRDNVDDLELAVGGAVDIRPVSDRREWNQRGRYLPMITPPARRMNILPIEDYFTLEELEINKLLTQVQGDMAQFRRLIGVPVPQRTDEHVRANWRRLEMDVLSAWSTGQLIKRDPQSGHETAITYPFATGGRYQTALTPWDDAGVDIYDEFLAWLVDGRSEMGPVQGVACRSEFIAMLRIAATVEGERRITLADLQQDVADYLGTAAFRFYPIDSAFDVMLDAGTTNYERQKTWPLSVIALVPQGAAVGTTAFAPVARAYSLPQVGDNNGVDLRGQTVYYEVSNAGRGVTFEIQLNAFPNPDEGRLWVMDTRIME